MDNAAPHAYLPNGNPGPNGGGTYNGTETNTIQADYENVFGPAARDIKFDPQRQKRHQRWHLPDVLKGPNFFLTDRVDGLITDTTYSPFTSYILPYVYLEHPDAKIKWNVWSFDEGLPSRAPYESGARVLTQTKKSYAGYTVRHAIGIRMEHNFMRSPDGIVNFQRQLKQLVGSIQNGNDLDVMMALIQAPSYAQQQAEKYYASQRNPQQLVRAYVDLFGIMQKSPVGLDVLLEECKQELKNWGAEVPSFMLVNSKFCMQVQMTPERTSYVTQGIDGVKRLRQGPDIETYRGLNIIKSRAFTIETGALPRDVLRRRVRVAEYYRIPAGSFRNENYYEFYDQSKDSWFRIQGRKLLSFCQYPRGAPGDGTTKYHQTARYLDANPLTMLQGVSNDTKQMEYTLDEWGVKPYNAKSSMLPSISNTLIQGSDKTTSLLLPTFYFADEQVFAQTITQGANVMTAGDTHPQAHVDASAWFGGGMFSDTTYHLADGHRAAFPLCNWASLDAYRVMNDADLSDPARFDEGIYAVGKHSTQEILAAAPANRKIFVAYRPNSYQFSWENAHNEKNIHHDAENVVGAAFSHCKLDAKFATGLWHGCGPISEKSQCGMYRLMVPMIPYGTSDAEIMSAINVIPSNKNPWCTVLMAGLASYFHPDSEVRGEYGRALNSVYPNHQEALAKYVNQYIQVPGTITVEQATGLFNVHSCLGNIGGSVPTELGWIDFNSNVDNNWAIATNPKGVPLDSVTPERAASLFFLTTAKRFFCAAQRFDNGGDYNKTQGVGLPLIPRSFAVLRSTGLPGGGLGAKVNLAQGGSKINENVEIVLIRPNIEHNMLGMILGRGGIEELGATFWGQTELNCFDDAEHGLWGMNYKYHERAQVMNEKNMIRLWDVCFDGYNGGMDDTFVNWADGDSIAQFNKDTEALSEAYNGTSFFGMMFEVDTTNNDYKPNWPNPIVFADDVDNQKGFSPASADPENIHKVVDQKMRVFNTDNYKNEYKTYMRKLTDFAGNARLSKPAGTASAVDETAYATALAFQGQMQIYDKDGNKIHEIQGAGHLGPSFPGIASVREGKGMRPQGNPHFSRLV
jgi:hypothetical protein